MLAVHPTAVGTADAGIALEVASAVAATLSVLPRDFPGVALVVVLVAQ